MFPRLLRLAARIIIRETTPKRFSPASKPTSGNIHNPAACTQCLIQTRAATTAEMGVKIHVVYCGGWGYRPKYSRLKTLLEERFPDDLEFTSFGTPTTTGYFEVQVNGVTVHSKKGGDGFVDSDEKLARIVSAIENALGK